MKPSHDLIDFAAVETLVDLYDSKSLGLTKARHAESIVYWTDSKEYWEQELMKLQVGTQRDPGSLQYGQFEMCERGIIRGIKHLNDARIQHATYQVAFDRAMVQEHEALLAEENAA